VRAPGGTWPLGSRQSERYPRPTHPLPRPGDAAPTPPERALNFLICPPFDGETRSPRPFQHMNRVTPSKGGWCQASVTDACDSPSVKREWCWSVSSTARSRQQGGRSVSASCWDRGRGAEAMRPSIEGYGLFLGRGRESQCLPEPCTSARPRLVLDDPARVPAMLCQGRDLHMEG